MRSTGWSPSLPLPPPASSPAATLAVAPASAQPRPPAQAARSPARAARSPARAALSLALSPVLAACLAAPPEQPVLEVRVAVPVPCIRTGVCLAGTLRLEQADGGQPCLFEDVPHHEPAGETTCDGLDNDCDGETDEGLRPGEGLGCGGATPGICREITPTCQGREGWQCLFPPDHEPGGETLCDGKDNDCDGATDEDLDGEAPFPCLDEHGEEARCPGGVLPAQRVCRAGRWECRYPDAEPCRLAGVCQGRGSGLAACRDGVWDCILDGPGPQMELGEEASCDLLDNDCDGRVDEGRCTHCRAFSSRDCTAANQVRSCDSSGGPDAAPAISCPDGGICLGPGTCGVQLEPELAQGETVVQGRVALAARAGWAPRGGTAEHALAALAVRSPGGAGSRILWQELDEQGQIVAEGRLGEAAADPVLAILPSAEAQAPCALLGWREQAAERAQLWVGRVGRGCPAGGGEPLLLAQGAMLGSPSLAADEQGHLAAAWTEGEAGSDSVRAVVWAENEERSLPEPREHLFSSLQPGGHPLPQVGDPVLAARPDGGFMLVVAARDGEGRGGVFALPLDASPAPRAGCADVLFVSEHPLAEVGPPAVVATRHDALPAGHPGREHLLVAWEQSPGPAPARLRRIVVRRIEWERCLGEQTGCDCLVDGEILAGSWPSEQAGEVYGPALSALAGQRAVLAFAQGGALRLRRLDRWGRPDQALATFPAPDGTEAEAVGAAAELAPGGPPALLGLAGDRVLAAWLDTGGRPVLRQLELSCMPGRAFCVAGDERQKCDRLGRGSQGGQEACPAEAPLCLGTTGMCAGAAVGQVVRQADHVMPLAFEDMQLATSGTGEVAVAFSATKGGGLERIDLIGYSYPLFLNGLTAQPFLEPQRTGWLDQGKDLATGESFTRVRLALPAPDRLAVAYQEELLLKPPRICLELFAASERSWLPVEDSKRCTLEKSEHGDVATAGPGYVVGVWRHLRLPEEGPRLEQPFADLQLLDARSGRLVWSKAIAQVDFPVLAGLADGRFALLTQRQGRVLLHLHSPAAAGHEQWLASEPLLAAEGAANQRPQILATADGRLVAAWLGAGEGEQPARWMMRSVVLAAGEPQLGEPQPLVAELRPEQSLAEPPLLVAAAGADLLVLTIIAQHGPCGELVQHGIQARRILLASPGPWRERAVLHEAPGKQIYRLAAASLADGGLLLLWLERTPGSQDKEIRYRYFGADQL